MNLQNLTEKTSFDRAYKQGIEDTIEDLIELNLLTIPVVSKSFYCNDESYHKIDKCNSQCNDCIKFIKGK